MKILTIGRNNFSPVRRAIRQIGWLTVTAFEERAGFRRALETLAREEFDFIFCELHPSRQPLFDRLAKLREAASNSIIVAITPSGSQAWDSEVLRTGADDFIERDEMNAATLSRVMRYAINRRDLLREYLRADVSAKRSSQVKSDFMANMSHEIRTPLNLIIGTADLLNETDLSPQQKRLVRSLSSAGNHLHSLLSDVLDLSQLEGQGLQCVDAGFSLADVFFEACEIISVMCRAKKLTFDYWIDPDLPPRFIGDKIRLRQVLLNVLNNAVKFTKRGNIQLRLEALEQNTGVKIVAKDTGIGIASSELSRVFDCFYQGESGLERNYRGTGLGLSIVKAIVDHYQGEIQLESVPGHGTQVNITLRLEADLGPSIPEIPHLRGKKILISTQGVLEAQSISHQLQKLGAATVWLSSGEAALQRLHHERDFDCAILDIQTDDIGALQMLRREDLNFPREKIVVLLPPLHRRHDIEDCANLGVAKYLYKPFAPGQFLQIFGQKLIEAESRPQLSRRINLLVVDDDFETRELMAALLANTPHSVNFAKDGFEAVARAQGQQFDVILMDIEMPGLNGYEATRRLRAMANCRATKIIGLSANAFPENVEEAKKVGFSGYLTKPIRKKRLLMALTECLQAENFYEAVQASGA